MSGGAETRRSQSCTGRSNVSWVKVTWDPLCGQMRDMTENISFLQLCWLVVITYKNEKVSDGLHFFHHDTNVGSKGYFEENTNQELFEIKFVYLNAAHIRTCRAL